MSVRRFPPQIGLRQVQAATHPKVASMTAPMGGQSADMLRNTLVAEMASVLRAKGADLEDERACMVALTGERFRAGDVVAVIDDAIREAQRAVHAEADPQWAKDEAWGGR